MLTLWIFVNHSWKINLNIQYYSSSKNYMIFRMLNIAIMATLYKQYNSGVYLDRFNFLLLLKLELIWHLHDPKWSVKSVTLQKRFMKGLVTRRRHLHACNLTLKMLCLYLLTRIVYILLFNHTLAVNRTLYFCQYEKLPIIVIHACSNITDKTILLKKCGPLIWLCLFTFWPIMLNSEIA